MTYLQLVNKVLQRLRESQVSLVSESEYSSMIAAFVNDAKREVEDAWNWTVLRTTIDVTTVAGTYKAYSLTGAGDRYRVLGMWNDTRNIKLRLVPDTFISTQNLVTNVQNANPIYVKFSGIDSSGDPTIDVYPTPDAADKLVFSLVVPQDDLSDGSTLVKVPWYPIMLQAYALALSERGEDGGVSYNQADARAQAALGDAVSQDAARVVDELEFKVE